MNVQLAKSEETKNYGKNGKKRYDVIQEAEMNTMIDHSLLIASKNKNPVFDRQIACVIGIICTSGLALTHILSLKKQDISSKYNEDLKRETPVIYYYEKNYQYELCCSPLTAKFLDIAIQMRNQYKGNSDFIFIAYNQVTQELTFLWNQFAHYNRNLMVKYFFEKTIINEFYSVKQLSRSYHVLLEECRIKLYNGETLSTDSFYYRIAYSE